MKRNTNGPRPRSAWARRSTAVGAALGAVSLIAAVLAAIWASGHIRVFAANRGLLQLVVVVPLTSLAAATGLTYFRILTVRQLCWAVLPIAALILVGTGLFEPGFTAWPWAALVSCVLFVPWVIGGLLGTKFSATPEGGPF